MYLFSERISLKTFRFQRGFDRKSRFDFLKQELISLNSKLCQQNAQIMSDLANRLSDLSKIPETDKNHAIKLLTKIFNNILKDLNWSKIRKKLEKCRPAFYLLYQAGFIESVDGTRLQWKYTNDNYNSLKLVNDSLNNITSKLPQKVINTPQNQSTTQQTESSKYKKQMQQKLKKNASEKERQRQLIKERIAASKVN
eukprot:5773_1